MPGQDGDRLALGAAILFAVLYLISGFVVAAPPKPSSSADAIQQYFIDHRDGVRASSYIAMVAGIPYLILIAGLRRRFVLVGGWMADTLFGAALLVAALASVGLLIGLGMTLHPSDAQPSTVASVFDVARYAAGSATGVVCILALAVGIGAVRHRLLPVWVGALSIAYAVYEILESLTLFGTHGAFGPGATINGIGTVLFLVWSVGVGVGLAQRAPMAAAN